MKKIIINNGSEDIIDTDTRQEKTSASLGYKAVHKHAQLLCGIKTHPKPILPRDSIQISYWYRIIWSKKPQPRNDERRNRRNYSTEHFSLVLLTLVATQAPCTHTLSYTWQSKCSTSPMLSFPAKLSDLSSTLPWKRWKERSGNYIITY